MFKNQITSLIKQAFATFNGKTDMFPQNFEILKSIMERTTAEDLDFHPQFSQNSLWQQPNKAPVTFIEIFDHDQFTVGIFVLKPGMKLPLHNHPEMYGLIKVIMGKVRVTSYSLNTEQTQEVDSRSVGSTGFSLSILRKASVITAERVAQDIVDVNDECCVLEPNRKNIHEIESVDGAAAFLDILSPPYESVIPGNGERKCSYYTILSQVTQNVYKLKEINSPSWYWTDSFPYTGPDFREAVSSGN